MSNIHGINGFGGPNAIPPAGGGGTPCPTPPPPSGEEPDQVEISPFGRYLQQISMLPEIRAEKVEEVRQALAQGIYDVEGKLPFALDKFLEEYIHKGLNIMENTKVFRMKTGRCEISDKKISLVRTGWRGKGAEILQSIIEKKSAPIPSEIEKEKIIFIEPHPPIQPIIRGYFWIHYRENGQPRKRIIILPGFGAGGKKEFEKAKSIFESEGLLDLKQEE